MLTLVALKLLLSHVVAAFLHPGYTVAKGRRWRTIVGQAALKLLLATILFASSLTWSSIATIVVAIACGIAIDEVERRSACPAWRAMLMAQVAHVVVLVGLAALLSSGGDLMQLTRRALGTLENPDMLLCLSVYVGAVAGGDAFVQKLTAGFAEQVPDLESTKPGLRSAGRYIGWLERSLIVTFIVGGYGEAVGFLIATKALARFPTLKSDPQGRFTDYFLIGTLTSVGLALFGGILLRMAGLTVDQAS